MRGSDLYLGLMATCLAFAAVVLRAGGMAWPGVGVPVVLAGALLIVMGWRSVHAEKVLVVGASKGGRLFRLRDAIDQAGFGTQSCPGPAVGPCPALQGEPCPVHGRLAAVVIDNSADYGGPVPPCGAALGVPALEVEEGSDLPPALGTRYGHIGGARGAVATVEALQAMLTAEATLSEPPTSAPLSPASLPERSKLPISWAGGWWLGVPVGTAISALAVAIVALVVAVNTSRAGSPSTTAASPTPAALATGTAGNPVPLPGGASTVTVTEKDFAIAPALSTAKAGLVDFTVANTGPSEHEFLVFKTDLAPDKLPLGKDGRMDESADGATKVFDSGGNIATNGSTTFHAALVPGAYVLVCNLPAHYLAGMHTAFTVTS